MKQKISMVLIYLLMGLGAFAQSDPAAKKIVTDLGNKYQSYQTAKIQFTVKSGRGNQLSLQDKGVLLVAPKENKYRIDFSEQTMISDGKQLWQVLKEEKEVQVTEVGDQEGTISPANLLTFYRQGYSYTRGQDEQVAGKSLTVIHLKPTAKQAYSEVLLRLDKSKNQIYDVTVLDKAGNRYQYTIQNLVANAQVNPKTFIFDKTEFPGMELVDLR